MIITISGVPGSGKTTVGKLVAERLGMPFYSVGALRGKMALDRGITLDELNRIGEDDGTTDASVDDYQKELGKTEDNFVIEGRLSWHFIPQSFKVFLDCDPHEAARRIFNARRTESGREDEPQYASEEEVAREIKVRIASDARRYRKYYDVDALDRSVYDLVLDTTGSAGPDAIVEQILERVKTAS
jgi:cytidylate kinase